MNYSALNSSSYMYVVHCTTGSPSKFHCYSHSLLVQCTPLNKYLLCQMSNQFMLSFSSQTRWEFKNLLILAHTDQYFFLFLNQKDFFLKFSLCQSNLGKLQHYTNVCVLVWLHNVHEFIVSVTL